MAHKTSHTGVYVYNVINLCIPIRYVVTPFQQDSYVDNNRRINKTQNVQYVRIYQYIWVYAYLSPGIIL